MSELYQLKQIVLATAILIVVWFGLLVVFVVSRHLIAYLEDVLRLPTTEQDAQARRDAWAEAVLSEVEKGWTE